MSDLQDIAEVLELSFLVHEELASAEQISRLEVLCQHSRSATHAYSIFSQMRGGIYSCACGDSALEASEKLDGDDSELLAAAARNRMPKMIEAAELSPNGLSEVHQTSTPVPLSLFGSKRNPYVLAGCTALVALGVYGSFVLIAWNLRPEKLPSFAPDSPDFVAMVRDTTDVQWSKNISSKSVESSILSGEPLKISSGTIELELKTGTKLIVEGPADWSVDSDNAVSLRAGKLLARVPKQAIGFSVETPTAKIVDLGTEFGIEVSESGATDVQVSKGKVELHPGILRENRAGQSAITLSAGAARRIEVNAAGEPVIRELTHEPHRFAPRVSTTQSSHLPIAGVMASSEYGLIRQANNLINGSGLHGNRHVNYANGTMWVSAVGHVEDEFVLFDLGQARRLDTMKVWNYNELRVDEDDRDTTTLYQERGVALADIYISDTGKWNPLKQPDDWRLVIADQRFTPADGTTNYATPDLVQLNHVTARFVAIVIKTKHRANQPTPEMRCVGLSEVQFYGERILRKEFPNRK